MELPSLPESPNLSAVYVPELLDFKDFDTEYTPVTNRPAESSPLIRLLSPTFLPKREIGALDQPHYNQNILNLLDDLQCPVLLLPRIKNEMSVQRIGFLTDILFTGRATLALLTKIAKSFQASITLFNIPEPALPEMDPGYANRYFTEQGLSEVNGMVINLVNIKKNTSDTMLEDILERHQITMAAATRQRKNILYKLVS